MECPLPGQPDSLVGHHVRLDRAISDTAQIVYCTVGILLRRMTSPHSTTSYDDQPHKSSPSPLSEFTHIVVDEVHERDVQTDFLLTLLLRVALPRNPHLRVILMSATASSQLFMDYFAAFRPCVLAIPGRTFPVETMWLEDCQRFAASQIQNYHDTLKEETEEEIMRPSKETSSTTTRLSPRATDVIDYVFIQSLIVSILRKQQADGDLHAKSNNTGDTNHRVNGAILVFLPGKAEIEALFRIMVRGTNDLPLSKDSLKLYKLHSGIPRGSQQVVFDPAPGGTVKIVLATNIAETSITIPDVSHVIDTGRVKESRYNPSSRIKELVTVWTSHASAKQRAGRAGRTTAGACYKLYSQSFSEAYLLTQTPPEMIRTPLDELILQLCLMYEQRRDELSPEGRADNNFPKGANPLQFLSQVPEPPPTASLEQACQHLLDVDALHVVDGSTSTTGSPLLYRLTPLGFHLSRLPMDAKVGKTLIVGCILECLEGALTIAATLSSSKSCFYSKFGKSPIVDRDYELAVEARARLIESGFGGNGWRGGTVKGDLITAIACYREWEKRSNDKERFDFACKNALDHTALKEIQELRKQYLELLVDAGFVSSHSASSWATPVRHARSKNTKQHLSQNQFQDDALLTSCCLVAGLYPNVCTLMRPRKGGPKGGRLLTKEGDVCRPQMQSFQRPRVQKAAETGKDAYAVYHNKHRSLGTGNRPGEVFLSEVNFVSRYALLLFSGELEIVKNAIVLDGWLKFKIGEKSVAGAVLLLALRDELDQSLLQKISRENDTNCEDDDKQDEEINELMNVVRQLLAEE
jgi:HrpA-like RNA helicase